MSKYTGAMKNISALLALTDGLRDLQTGLKEADTIEREIELLKVARDEQRTMLTQLQGQVHKADDERTRVVDAAKVEAKAKIIEAETTIATMIQVANTRLVQLNTEIEAADRTLSVKVNEGAKVIQDANHAARCITTEAAAAIEAQALALREREAALAIREAKLTSALKSVGNV